MASAAVLQHAGSATAFADLGSSRNAGRADVVCGVAKFDRRTRRRDVSGLSLTVFEVESDQREHRNLMHVIAAPQHQRVMWLFRQARANAFTPTAIVQNETVKCGIQAACGIQSISAVRASPWKVWGRTCRSGIDNRRRLR
jgi:hypothetical protein